MTTQSVPGTNPVLLALSCAAVDDCVVVGSEIVVTTDGGSTWRTGRSPPGVGEPTVISCPDGSACVAAGAASTTFFTSNGGKTWRTGTVPNSYTLTVISCPATTDCVAVAGGRGAVLTTGDGGRTWNLASVAIGGFISGISCPTMSDCVAVGENDRDSGPIASTSTDRGSTWIAWSLPSGRLAPERCLVPHGLGLLRRGRQRQ